MRLPPAATAEELFAGVKWLVDENVRLREALAKIMQAETVQIARTMALVALAQGGTD